MWIENGMSVDRKISSAANDLYMQKFMFSPTLEMSSCFVCESKTKYIYKLERLSLQVYYRHLNSLALQQTELLFEKRNNNNWLDNTNNNNNNNIKNSNCRCSMAINSGKGYYIIAWSKVVPANDRREIWKFPFVVYRWFSVLNSNFASEHHGAPQGLLAAISETQVMQISRYRRRHIGHWYLANAVLFPWIRFLMCVLFIFIFTLLAKSAFWPLCALCAQVVLVSWVLIFFFNFQRCCAEF
jgi:hypothetical protein